MKRHTAMIYTVLLLLLAVSGILSMMLGSVPLSWSEIWGGVRRAEGYETERIILYALRLPRLLSALVAGVGLSLAGVLLQSVMGNPLASPNTVGVNAGAGLAVIVGLWILPTVGGWLPVVAFLGALAAALLVLGLSRSAGGGKSTVILAGIACTTLFQAIISFVSTLDTDVLSMYNGFSIGSFVGVEMAQLWLPGVLVAGCWCIALVFSSRIATLSLGDFVASGLGIRVRAVRGMALCLAAMSAAAVISFAGLLGFVGLVVPHISRRLVGEKLSRNLLAAPLIGGILVILSDLVGRTLFAPSEVSVGIVMALIGAPFFVYLLLRRDRRA